MQVASRLTFALILSLVNIAWAQEPRRLDGEWVDLAAPHETQWSPSVVEFERELPRDAVVIVGEQHYTPTVQAAEAELIQIFRPVQVAWEFLNFDEQALIDLQMDRLKRGEIELLQFFDGIPSVAASAQIKAYLPVVEAAWKIGARLLALNAPREIKRKLRLEGLDALPLAYRPAHFDTVNLGSKSYRERFERAMSEGHSTPEEVASYYLAQCYTDDVMAQTLGLNAPAQGRTVVIVGAFHTDYGLGLARRITAYSSRQWSKNIKLLDSSQLTSHDKEDLIRPDSVDGQIADAIGFVRFGAPRQP